MIALMPLSVVARVWTFTLHFDISPEDEKRLREQKPERVFVIWHNRLFLAAEIIRRFRKPHPLSGLISASKDGAWLAAFYRVLGIGVVRGSSSHRGARALQDCLDAMHDGSDIAITPDGPRGPRYSVKAGSVWLATKTGSPLALIGADFRRAYRFKSWDGFYLPRPFSTVRLRCSIYQDTEALKAAFPDTNSEGDALKKAMVSIHETLV